MALLLLIDGHSQAYRAYFGMKTPLSTRDGEPTGAVYGFARKLLSTLREYKPEYVAVAFDTGDTWRHAEFPEYKATRDAMPDDMRTQMTRIEELLRAFNIPIVTYPNFEADDILGTLAGQAAAQGRCADHDRRPRHVPTGRRPRPDCSTPPAGQIPSPASTGVAEVYERYGLTPAQFIDFKALTGDTSDNIPGVPGVGEKTAVKFLQQYGSLDNLYAHIDEISGAKTRQNLIDAPSRCAATSRLVTISTDLDLVYDADACRTRSYYARCGHCAFQPVGVSQSAQRTAGG
jgi:DNA polymerase-1